MIVKLFDSKHVSLRVTESDNQEHISGGKLKLKTSLTT